MLTVRTSDWDKKKNVRQQQSRDVRLRKARRDAIHAHETQGLKTREAGQDRRAQMAGEFGLAGQRLANQGALATGAQSNKASMAELQTAQAGLGSRQQAGFTEAAKVAGQQQQYDTASRGQIADINKATAAQANKYQNQQFSKDLGKQAYLSGQDPSTASQIAASGSFPIDYAALKPFNIEQPKSYKRIAPTYDKSLVPQMIEPGGAFESTTGTTSYDTDKRSLKALLKKMEDEEKLNQGLGR